MNKRLFTLFIVLMSVCKGFSQDSILRNRQHRFLPDYAKMQFAGNIGFISGGFGYQFLKRHIYLEGLYGYVPSSISRAKRIHTFTIKNTFIIVRKHLKKIEISPIVGFTASLEAGESSFGTLPNKYPAGYYKPNYFHATLYIGILAHKDFVKPILIKGVDFYSELGTVDTYLWYKLSSNEVKIVNIVSLSLGTNLYL